VNDCSTDRQALDGRPAEGGRRRRRGAPLDGVVLLDKPRGLSSNHAMLAVRRLMGAAKAGHGGTLDPMAHGLLPVMLGEATKFADHALQADKTYLATLTLGQTSTTGDAEGEISDSGAPLPCRRVIDDALLGFVGPLEQIPPMHSALKHKGRPLYELARAGTAVERPARSVIIHALEPLECAGSRLTLRVTCSKGTYIRVLAEDIGRALGCGAWLSDLRREAAGGLSLGEEAVTLDELEALEVSQRLRHILPVECLLDSFERIELDDEQARRFMAGQRLRLRPRTIPPASGSIADEASLRVCVYGRRSCSPSPSMLLGLATFDDGVIAPLRLISTQDQERPK
jgi:tRNA pseudouridine55 synthase